MPKHFISKKDLKVLKEKVSLIGLSTSILNGVEVEEIKDEKCFFVNRKPFVYEKPGEIIIPTLFMLNDLKPESKYVGVDDGAVPHIMNGANVFAQGITDMDMSIKAGDVVFVRNKDRVFIAVGIAERDAVDIIDNKKGEAVKLVHYPDDRIFKAFYR